MTGLLTLAGTFDPSKEFELKQWIGIHLGPIDMSINKAVVYLAISALLTIALGLFTMRSRLALLPDKRQTVGEAIKSGKTLNQVVTMQNGQPVATTIRLSERMMDVYVFHGPGLQPWQISRFPTQVRNTYEEIGQGKPWGEIAGGK